VPRNWQPQLREALARVAAARPDAPPPAAAEVADLPLVELPATGAVARPELAVILSGDGGWAGLDKEVGGALAARGIPVVGWSSLQYYWHARTPEEAAHDLERTLRHYLAAWGRERAVLVGYSFGADVLPFLVQRLPADLRQRIAEVALLSPSTTAQFEFHVVEWIGHDAADALPTAPAIASLAGLRLFCFKGEKEADSGCDAVTRELG
jgi:type IV secretory pathway VirJ component